jgi:hypothetical protein
MSGCATYRDLAVRETNNRATHSSASARAQNGWKLATAASRASASSPPQFHIWTATMKHANVPGNRHPAHSKLEKSSDEIENVKDDRSIGPASARSTFWPRI